MNHSSLLYSVLFLLSTGLATSAQEETLYDSFKEPPMASRPLVYWHWMGGNITPEGLRKDILWMKESGIVGFNIVDAGYRGIPQIVDKRLKYMSDPWKETLQGAIKLADSLGMEVTISSTPGWGTSGGPWVEPADAMKKLVWSTVDIAGGKKVEMSLPEPNTVTGSMADRDSRSKWKWYEDVAVLAVRVPESYIDIASLGPKISSSGGTFTAEQLNNGRVSDYSPLLPDDVGRRWIQYSFKKPLTVKSLTWVVESPRNMRHNTPIDYRDSLLVSDDGVHFRIAALMPIGSTNIETFDIEPVTARYFRFTFSDKTKKISELAMHTEFRVDHSEEKAAFGGAFDIYDYPTPAVTKGDIVREVIDLKDFCSGEVLCWRMPKGKWRIYRFGASLTGRVNHPASSEATGLEVDKLSPNPWKRYFRTYLDMFKEASGDYLGKRGIRYINYDSYEAYSQTWTSILPEQFLLRRGYSLTRWLPALTGVIVDSVDETERFLWDWRMTLSELFEENYDIMSDILRNEYGLEGAYVEGHASGRVYPFDGMMIKKNAAVPMGEMWVPQFPAPGDRVIEGITDIRESASVAHIYGKDIVAAESLTCGGLTGSAFSYCPENLKRTADYEFSAGVTRFVIHSSAHQPVDDKNPGIGLGQYGQWFHRHETWAHQAKVWTDYIARSCFLLSQGKFVADVLWFYGEDSNASAVYSRRLPDIPDSYNYDYASPDVLYNKISVRGGNLVTESGMEYKLLVIDPAIVRMSEKMLERLLSLAREGAVLCGGIPLQCASLRDDPARFSAIREKLVSLPNVHDGVPCSEMIGWMGVSPDFIHPEDIDMLYVHRSLDDKEIYWVKSLSYDEITAKVSFRTCGRVPELWRPDDGSMEALSYRIDPSLGRTEVCLNLRSDDAVFIVFDKPADCLANTVEIVDYKAISVIDGPWTVSFQDGRGGPSAVTFKTLLPLNESEDPLIRYFSGTASYSCEFNYSGPLDKPVALDLGDVKNVAEVFLNGISVGTLWKRPFRADISAFLRPGKNSLEIRVTNLWVNRIIGDLQPDCKEKVSYTHQPFYKATDPILPSGLIGPLRIMVGNNKK